MAGKLNVCENQIYYNTVHNKTVMQNRCHDEYYIYEENHHKKKLNQHNSGHLTLHLARKWKNC